MEQLSINLKSCMTAIDLETLLKIHNTTKGMDLDLHLSDLKTLRKRGFIDVDKQAVRVTHLGKVYIENVLQFMR